MIDLSTIHPALSKDSEGYVFWKGTSVEHYSFDDEEAEAKAARELASRCEHLDSIGVEINSSTTVWRWNEYAPDAEEKRKLGISVYLSLKNPLPLNKFVTEVVNKYNINGTCDAPYIANCLRAGNMPWAAYRMIPESDHESLTEQAHRILS